MVLLKSALSKVSNFIASLSSTMHHRGSLSTALKSTDPSTIIPHLSPLNPEDDLMRAMNRNIPISVQHYIRDKGVMRFLADNSAAVAAASLGASKPSILYRFIDAGRYMKSFKYGDIEGQNCQVYNFEASIAPTAKVLILVHGGAWGSGKPWMYRLMACGMANSLNAAAAIVVQYPLFPECNISGQVDSVFEAVRFVRWNAQKLGLPEGADFVLAGHSSGANICALAILKSMEREEKLVDSFLGLCGVYDIEKHYAYESCRGAHEFSPMSVAAISPDRWWEFSPTLLIPKMSKEKFLALWPQTLLVHGVVDTTVPYSSTQEFAEQLLFQGAPVITSYPVTTGHADCIFEFTNPESGIFGDIINKFYSLLKKNSMDIRDNKNVLDLVSGEIPTKVILKSKL